ncbi:MAG: phytase [Saprospiraceae bacterium]|nr:phytase [Saprospiraceae bacterium]
MSIKLSVCLLFSILLFSRCSHFEKQAEEVLPIIVTQAIAGDTDDPAIWLNPEDRSKSIIIGTDKGGDHSSGAIYIYRLDGSIDSSRSIFGLQRPNNVDVEYGLTNGSSRVDIAVFTERDRNMVRVFRLPEMKEIDRGGLPVFVGELKQAPMGIALYKDPDTQQIYAIVGRKEGPADGYLFQYQLLLDSSGSASIIYVRKFGKYSGQKEIESIVVDDELGFVYYSDEGVGVRKYHAHPDRVSDELALFATQGIKEDHEGLSIYKKSSNTGYILLSDQQANTFHVFPREGLSGKPHQHPCMTTLAIHTRESDGSEMLSDSLSPVFPKGIFVAMSTDGTFQLYDWRDFQKKIPK